MAKIQTIKEIKEESVPKITDLIDISILQQIQDWAAMTAGVPILIRDAYGYPVTKASLGSEFCSLISGEDHTNPECRESNIRAAELAAKAGKPQKYTCFAGLTQFAAPIQIEGHIIGTIVLGDRPTEPIPIEKIVEIANKFNIDQQKLIESARKVEIWSEETINSTTNFLYSIANTLFTLCYQGYSLNKNVKELSALLEISQLLTSSLGLQEVLDKITEGIVKVLNVKASTIRLLNDKGDELILKSIYNLSPQYLSKGPVFLEDHPICRSALDGEVSIINDITDDPRFYYNESVKSEGLSTMLCAGLRIKDKAIGTIHLYTGEPREFTKDEIMLIQSIASQAAIAIENAKLYEQSLEKQRIERELTIAGEIQYELLPKMNPSIDRFDIKTKFLPYGKLSGDLYDLIELDDKNMGLVIADVSGKGIPSAILMATTHATIRANIGNGDNFSASKIIDAVNRYICDYSRTTEFVTAFYGILNSENLTLRYTNAGHNPPIIFRKGVGFFLEVGGIPAGIIKDTQYAEEQIELLPDDIILLYTDGAIESVNSKKEMFGLRRIMQIVQKNYKADPEELIDIIYSQISEFLDGTSQSDDITFIVIKVR
ncbi:MAG: SpoIIE family protein phosphatase [Candidatus Poribacteria bacterium]